MKQRLKLYFAACILSSLAAYSQTVNSNHTVSPRDIISLVRSNSGSLDIFQKDLSDLRANRQQFTRRMLDILLDSKSSELSKVAAVFCLGEIRAVDAVNPLAKQISLEFNFRKYYWSNFPPDFPQYPAVDALVEIGNPSIPAVIRNLAESDTAKVRDLSLQALTRIDVDKDISQLRLQKALKAEKNPQKQARLQAAIKSLVAVQ